MAWMSLEEVTILLQSKPWAWLEGDLIITMPWDQDYFWGCDVLLVTSSVGRVSDVAIVDNGSLVKLGVSSHLFC